MGEEYNGWTNRETWALNLWLGNDEGLYHMTLETAAAVRGYSARRVGETIVEMVKAMPDNFGWDSLADVPDWYHNMMLEVGSMWRVDELELGEAWLEQLGEGEV